MKAYLIILAIVTSIIIISGIVNEITGKKNKNSLIFNVSDFLVNQFSIIFAFLFWGGLIYVFC